MSKIPLEYLDNSNDFGFTAVFESEVVDPIVSDVKTSSEEEHKKTLQTLEKLILPLLVNLMKNPEKEYIHWPNRVPMIEKQIDRILEITRAK
jgi:acetyl-CoA carboxylase alpha subunit